MGSFFGQEEAGYVPPTLPTLTPDENAAYQKAILMGDEIRAHRLEGIANGRMGPNGWQRSPSPNAMPEMSGMPAPTAGAPSMMGLPGIEMPVVPDWPADLDTTAADASGMDAIIEELMAKDRTRGGDAMTATEKGAALAYGNKDLDHSGYDRLNKRTPFGLEAGEDDLLPPPSELEDWNLPESDPVEPELDTPDTPVDPYKKPASPMPGEGFGVEGGPGTKVNTEAAIPEDTTPVKPNSMNGVERFFADQFGWDEEKRSKMGDALMSAGFAMMAGDSPYAMQNIGKGGLAGIQAYQNAEDDAREQGLEEEALRMEKDLHEIKMAESRRAAEKYKYDVSQRGKPGQSKPLSTPAKIWADAEELSRISGGVHSPEAIIEKWIENGVLKNPNDAFSEAMNNG